MKEKLKGSATTRVARERFWTHSESGEVALSPSKVNGARSALTQPPASHPQLAYNLTACNPTSPFTAVSRIANSPSTPM